MALPLILILAFEEDAHAVTVETRIRRLTPDIEPLILDTADFPQKFFIESKFWGRECRAVLHLGDRRISSENVHSVWWRRPRPPQIADTIEGETARDFTFRECEYALEGTWHLFDCLWVNDPQANRRANKKLYQLKVAQQCGFRIPKTLVTNHPQVARKFWEDNDKKIIYKQVRGIRTRLIQTSLVTEREVEMLDSLQLAPVIFQEFIPAHHDLRITVIDDHVFPALIDSQNSESQLDWRWDNDVPVRRSELPEEVRAKIEKLMQRLGLLYGAIDMRVTPEGEYVFFEINPSGQFVFVEIQTGWPLSELFAQLLIDGASNSKRNGR